MDLGNTSKRMILTGAGWSRNWGGLLAQEVWQNLSGDPSTQGNPRLRELLLGEPSFEAALAAANGPAFEASDRQLLEAAVMAAFASMDREIDRPDHPINIYKAQELVFRVVGSRQAGVDTGYLFTLNQDLWPERHLYNDFVHHSPPPVLPGIRPIQGVRGFDTNVPPYGPALNTTPLAEPSTSVRLRGATNVIKLHGSFNWRTTDGRNAMVIGEGKADQIGADPLLSWYQDVFREVLCQGDVRLLIVGYGFGDPHINAIIADAVENHGLKVFIWDVGSNLMQRVNAAPHGAVIWKGLLSTCIRPMSEVFPANQAVTEEYKRLIQQLTT